LPAEIHIRRLPPGTNELEIIGIFKRWTLAGVNIPTDRSGRQKGFARVTLVHAEDAVDAVKELSGYQLRGRKITITLASENPTESSRTQRPKAYSALAQNLSQPTSSSRDFPSETTTRDHIMESATKSSLQVLVIPQICPVYLCDRESFNCAVLHSASDAVAAVKEEPLDRVVQKVVAPCAAYIGCLLEHQQELPPSHSKIRSDLERTARFFMQVFYNALVQHGRISDDLRRRLAGYPKNDISVLTASAGQAVRLTSHLASELSSCNQEFLQRGIRWWTKRQWLLREAIDLCNVATHLTAQLFKQFQAILPKLNQAFIELASLNWILVAEEVTGTTIILDGPTAQTWRSIDKDVPANKLSLYPFLLFRGATKRLDAFQGSERSARYLGDGSKYICLGEQPARGEDFHLVSADPELSREIGRHCAIDDWRRQFAAFDRSKARSEEIWSYRKYGFDDLRGEKPQRLYGRDVELQALEHFITGSVARGQKAVFVVGPQGIGKSALLWTLLDRLGSVPSLFSFFFREGDQRCDLQSFLEASAIGIARHRGIPLLAESPEDQFREALAGGIHALEGLTEVPILVLDGLDGLAAQRPGDFLKLLEVIDSTDTESVFWMCSSQPLPGLVEFVERNQRTAALFSVRHLSPDARRSFLREELKASAAVIKPPELQILLSNYWIERVVTKLDAGLPLYVRAVLDSAIAADYRDPDKIPPTLDEHWRQSIARLTKDITAIRVATLLSLAFAPLPAVQITEILSGPEPVVIEDILRRYHWFVQGNIGWSINPPALRQYIRESAVDNLRICRIEASRDLRQWVLDWKIHKNPYVLEFLPQHLEDEDHGTLLRLSFDDSFLVAQAEQFPQRPEVPADTIYRALKAACKDGAIHEVVTLALRHAEYVARMSRVATLADEFANEHFVYVAHLATLLDEDMEQILWKLVAAAGAIQTGKIEDAQQIMAHLELSKSGPGFQRKYERPAAIALAVLASAIAEGRVDLEQPICDTAANVLGRYGKAAFFESLGNVRSIEPFVSLLPVAEKPRLQALRSIARALGRQGELAAVSKLSTSENSSDQLRLEAIAGLVESRHFDSAIQLALQIQRDNLRRLALCDVAAGVSEIGGLRTDLNRVVLTLEKFWDAAPGVEFDYRSTMLFQDKSSSLTGAMLSDIAHRIAKIKDSLPAVSISARLGVVQYEIEGADSFLHIAEDVVERANSEHADQARLEVLRAYLRLNRWDDAKRVMKALSGRAYSRAVAEILADESNIESDLPIDKLETANLSIQAGSELASVLSKGGRGQRAIKILVKVLLALHSAKAEKPSLWGKPRVLGEIAGALHSLGRTPLAERYFGIAERSLNDLRKGEWHIDRAFAFVNLAEARLFGSDFQLTEDVIEQVDDFLHAARRVAVSSPILKWKPAVVADLLAEIWEIRHRHGIQESRDDLAEALAIARGALVPILKVNALIEIARHQAKFDNVDATRSTLDEAYRSASAAGPDEQAAVLLGRALCGEVDGLLEETESSKMVMEGDARQVVCRAEVELFLHLGEIDAAEEALEKIEDVDVRAHASRNVARKCADMGNFSRALLIAQRRIGARRSELIPDVSEAIAAHAWANDSSRVHARQVLLNLLQETAPYLDGTYRLIASVVRSRAFALDSSALERLVDSLALERPLDESEGR
jgi:hypothetical protein